MFSADFCGLLVSMIWHEELVARTLNQRVLGSSPSASTTFHHELIASQALPAPPPTAGSSKQSHDEKQQYRTGRCIDDRTDHSGAQMDTEPRQQPVPDKRARYPEKEVANDS